VKVTFIFAGSYPYGQIQPKRAHLLCKSLVEEDIEVLMIITQPTERKDNVYNVIPQGSFEGVKYMYIGGSTIRKESLIFRIFDTLYCRFILFFSLLFNSFKSDFVIVLGASFDFRILLPALLKLTKSKSILEINEYPLVNKRNNNRTKLLRGILFNLIFPLYDGFIPISTELEKLISDYKSTRAKSIIIPILGRTVERNKEQKKTRPIESFYIFHAGSLFESKDGILGMIKAFGQAKDRIPYPVKLVLTGSINRSPHKNEIENLITKYELVNDIIFTGFLSEDELDVYFTFASLAIINKKLNLQNQYCFASKLAEYMAYSIPVITTNVGDASLYLKDNVDSYFIYEDSTDILADKIVEFFNEINASRSQVASNAKKTFETHFNYETHRKPLVRFLFSLKNQT